MEKIGTGHEGKELLIFWRPPGEFAKVGRSKGCRVSDLTAVILDRERHFDLIDDVRAAGAESS